LGKSRIPFYVNIVSTILHGGWAYFFINYLGLEVKGAAIAFTMTQFLIHVFLYAIIPFIKEIKDGWFFSISEALTDLKSYLSIGIYSALLVCLEFWSMNIITFMSGFLTVNQNSAMVALASLTINLYSFGFGISIATSVIVGI
jgi:MATE family multidrug resistance protein